MVVVGLDRQGLVAMTAGFALEDCRWTVARYWTRLILLGLVLRLQVALLLRAIVLCRSVMSLLRVRGLRLRFGKVVRAARAAL